MHTIVALRYLLVFSSHIPTSGIVEVFVSPLPTLRQETLKFGVVDLVTIRSVDVNIIIPDPLSIAVKFATVSELDTFRIVPTGSVTDNSSWLPEPMYSSLIHARTKDPIVVQVKTIVSSEQSGRILDGLLVNIV